MNWKIYFGTGVIPHAPSFGRQEVRSLLSPSREYYNLKELTWWCSHEVVFFASLTFPLTLSTDTGSYSMTVATTLRWWKYCFPSPQKMTHLSSYFLILPSLIVNGSLILQGRLPIFLSHFWFFCCIGVGLGVSDPEWRGNVTLQWCQRITRDNYEQKHAPNWIT